MSNPLRNSFAPLATRLLAIRGWFRARVKPALRTEGKVLFVGAGPGAADLLTVRALAALQAADLVIHDRLISDDILAEIPARTPRIDVGKEGYGASTPQADINELILREARRGACVVRLKSGDSSVFGRLDEEIEACDAAGVAWNVVPGITAASAAVAAIGQSLTRRGRNSSVRFLTGHDMKGFADHDWTSLARPGEVAAIYMGRKSARFIQGRLIMHGADRDTPVTLVENASRADERVVATTLGALAQDLDASGILGPTLTFIGLPPRRNAGALRPGIFKTKQQKERA
ncbi:uroporphyrinogen-III C-methyltransferase [Sedimentitalea sp. JM2-8]|uniref:uroporphyrinogen-III C-methyltransferase n=1 Tax=Sedimentitalea xiamensis TaxID=3050037 RepID=A0ABT7FAA6_9RHOB|nr:uroporphyrinogen-III C-methyltransferase [Sedimentitalea xiamensis]MDK3072032.1 uroporphyrinogen-III C-methyltransferase [Sedimentitalea xiamensis]